MEVFKSIDFLKNFNQILFCSLFYYFYSCFFFSKQTERKPEDGPPTTGEEYLMHVRWEAKSVPKVVVSNIDPRKYDNNQTTHWTTTTFIAAPKGLEPPTEWANSFLITFKHLREVNLKLIFFHFSFFNFQTNKRV